MQNIRFFEVLILGFRCHLATYISNIEIGGAGGSLEGSQKCVAIFLSCTVVLCGCLPPKETPTPLPWCVLGIHQPGVLSQPRVTNPVFKSGQAWAKNPRTRCWSGSAHVHVRVSERVFRVHRLGRPGPGQKCVNAQEPKDNLEPKWIRIYTARLYLAQRMRPVHNITSL